MKNAFMLGFGLLLAATACKTSTQTSVETYTTDTARIDGHPAWIMQGNIYEVNVRQYTPEGSFAAFAKHLDRLKEMGVQTLWFMPIQPISKLDRKGVLGSYYAVSNYTDVNPEYGTLADWQALVDSAHAKGFKVIIDWVPNHTGADHYWLEKHPDFYVRDSATGKAKFAFDWSDTRDLNYDNPELQDSMINAMKFWLGTHIDGFRCDVAGEVPQAFWAKAVPALKAANPGIFMLAESNDSWLNEVGFDATYPWEEFSTMKKIASGEWKPSMLDSSQAKLANYPANTLRMYFTSNHDENSWNKADWATMPGAVHAPFAVLTQTWARSVPLIYSGQEEPFLDSIRFFYKDTIEFGKFARADFYKTLLNLRKNNAALSANASYAKVAAGDPNQVFSFCRAKDGQKVLVVLNLSAKDATVAIQNPALKGTATNVFTGAKEDPTAKPWKLEPWGYAVYSY
ncbi:MAG TPA: alpha-amylase family glycosyl hydrolase [Phnomibacter sp.]|nr:alpha-amylase family glycosyl hydrolase [Phnomibacter sp.]